MVKINFFVLGLCVALCSKTLVANGDSGCSSTQSTDWEVGLGVGATRSEAFENARSEGLARSEAHCMSVMSRNCIAQHEEGRSCDLDPESARFEFRTGDDSWCWKQLPPAPSVWECYVDSFTDCASQCVER